MLWVQSMSHYDKCCFNPEGFKYKTFREGWEDVSSRKKSGSQSATKARLFKKAAVEQNFTVNSKTGDFCCSSFSVNKKSIHC